MENWASCLPNASERPEINYIETSIIVTDFKMGSQTLCNLFHWAHAGLDHCNHGKKKATLKSGFIMFFFTFASLIQKNVKSVRPFRPSCLWTIICHVLSFTHLQHTRGRECLDPETWSWALYAAGQGNDPAKRISPARWAHTFGWDSLAP